MLDVKNIQDTNKDKVKKKEFDRMLIL